MGVNKNLDINKLNDQQNKNSNLNYLKDDEEEKNMAIGDESNQILMQKSPTLITNLKEQEKVNDLLFSDRGELSNYLIKTRGYRKNISRKLSKHVTTRWYRSPEIILCENEYDYKVDIWSAGCIFAELLNIKKGNRSSYIKDFKLFMGGYCPPLSPKLPEKSSNLQKDQMTTIMEILGNQDDQSLSFITNEIQIQNLKKNSNYPKKEWKEIIPNISEDEASLLSKMLEFNPYFRPTAEECLHHPYFYDTIECIPYKPAEGYVNLNMDKYKTIDIKLIKKIIWDEVEFYKTQC